MQRHVYLQKAKARKPAQFAVRKPNTLSSTQERTNAVEIEDFIKNNVKINKGRSLAAGVFFCYKIYLQRVHGTLLLLFLPFFLRIALVYACGRD